jgi:hypothetical protein
MQNICNYSLNGAPFPGAVGVTSSPAWGARGTKEPQHIELNEVERMPHFRPGGEEIPRPGPPAGQQPLEVGGEDQEHQEGRQAGQEEPGSGCPHCPQCPEFFLL